MEACHNCKKSPFRWLLAAARYAAASVVTVLILIVMVKAIKVLLHPESLAISVAEGCIFVHRIQSEEPEIKFMFNLKLVNPRSDVRMHFDNITVYCFSKDTPPASTPDPVRDCLVFFMLDGISVTQQEQVSYIKSATVRRDPDEIVPSFFDMLYNRRSHASITSDVTIRMEGILTQEISISNNHTRKTTYYCWPLVVGLDSDIKQDYILTFSLEDVFCREEEGKHLI